MLNDCGLLNLAITYWCLGDDDMKFLCFLLMDMPSA